MNPMSAWQELATQGPIFWVAAAAVALGTTLLVAAATLQWRRRRPRRRPSVRTTATGYTAAQRLPEAPEAVPAPDLAPRLAAAADRLAAIHAELTAQGAERPDSGLKEPVTSVEYVFKSGEA